MFKPERILTILLLGLVAYAGIKIWSVESENTRLVLSDGRGYFSYLPATIIHQDLQYGFLEEINAKYWQSKPLDFIVEVDGQTVNKYTSGVAVLWLPFFLLAHFLSIILGWEADGYAAPYQIAIAFSALVYLYLGLRFLAKLMREFQLKEWAISCSLLLIVLATNLLHYAVHEVSMSHVYSFFAVSAFMYFAMRWLRHNGSLFWVAIFLAMIMLIRPTNVMVILLLPFLAGSWNVCREKIVAAFKQPLDLVLSLVIGFMILSIQLLFYKAQTGSFLVDSYPEEGFNFLQPELFNVLFSYRKGLLIWSPFILLSFFGFFSVLKRSRLMALSLFAFIGAGTYLIAAWHMWYFGGSFGHRAFIDMYPVFAVMIGFFFSGSASLSIFISGLISFCVLVPLNLVQTYQFSDGIIPFDGMNAKKYRQVWLKTHHSFAGVFDPYALRSKYTGKDSVSVYHNLDSEQGWGNEQQLTTETNYTGSGCAVMNPGEMYGITFRKRMGELGIDAPDLVRVSFWAKAESRSTTALMVISQQDSTGNAYSWQAVPLGLDIKGTGRWCKMEFVRELAPAKDASDEMLLYILKENPQEVLYYDDLEIRLIDG